VAIRRTLIGAFAHWRRLPQRHCTRHRCRDELRRRRRKERRVCSARAMGRRFLLTLQIPEEPRGVQSKSTDGRNTIRVAPRASRVSAPLNSNARRLTSPQCTHLRTIPIVSPYRRSAPSGDSDLQVPHETIIRVISKAKNRPSGPATAFPSDDRESSIIASRLSDRSVRS